MNITQSKSKGGKCISNDTALTSFYHGVQLNEEVFAPHHFSRPNQHCDRAAPGEQGIYK